MQPGVPAFSVTYHRVNVSIDRQVATTTIDQAFRNEARVPLEGQYLFPIPEDASLGKFSLLVGGEELEHTTLEAGQARKLFEEIVSQQKNAALLEWLGQRTIRARVGAIPSGAEKPVRVSYTQLLSAEHGVVKYVYPLAIEKLSNQPLRELDVKISIQSPRPIRSVYSPTHNVTVKRVSDTSATVTLQEKNVRPDRDLVLYFTQSEGDVGLDLLTFKDKDEDGYFLLLAAPRIKLDEKILPKDILFVFDTSGSMSGEKIEQARKALQFCLNSLDPRDRFNVVRFSTDVQNWRDALMPASKENVKDAVEFVKTFQARGGTNIQQALQSGLKGLEAADRPYPRMVLFLTDGLPTVGQTNVENIMKEVAPPAVRDRIRVFCFGVGNDVNAHFLDKLADKTRGSSENVLPAEDIEVKVSNLFDRISAPLLADLKLDFGKAQVHDVYPQELPDLFRGSQLLITGRYRLDQDEPLDVRISLSGEAGGKAQKFTLLATLLPETQEDDVLPRLWATRKIGWLEDQIRLNGTSKELVEEIIRLSREFGILTQYTAFLVETETLADGRRVPKAVAGGLGGFGGPAGPAGLVLRAEFEKKADEARREQSGAFALSQSVNTKRQRANAQVADNVYLDRDGRMVAMNQAQTRKGRAFFQAGDQWVDPGYDAKMVTTKVRAYSPAYFQIAGASRSLAQWMSLGENVIVKLEGDRALEVNAKAGRENVFTDAELRALLEGMSKDKPTGLSQKKRAASLGGGAAPLALVAGPVALMLLGGWYMRQHATRAA